ncbi:M23 family metallopeptidase [Hydrogenimonas urashimensis]|uniref:M23 family metallopeptidase n=1 Tax=Hydrogenimonas urashimensis TaxID=2740515 RepID=UPI001915AC24|nr:M23 family metallopeptidase [Hydrogenimonas urashimensis]
MKNRFLVTITDTKTFRQYTLKQIVKGIGLAVIGGLVVTGAATWFYLEWLEDAYDEAKLRQKVLERQIGTLEHNISTLNRHIEVRQRELDRLGDRLSDLEVLVGQKPDTNFSTSTRLENVTLSAAQIALLFSIVPNGEPLPMEGVTSAFGWRRHPIRKSREFHPGIDLRAKRGNPVWTTADGVVEYSGYHKRSGYGNLVIVDHGFGFKTYYGHLKTRSVHKGDTLVKGDLIGLSGNTGLSTAPHLHYEIRFLTRPVNPYWFIRWKKERYRSIFRKVKQVPWESFIALVSHMAAQALPPSSHQQRP